MSDYTAFKQEAEGLASAIRDSPDEALPRLNAHWAAMSGHWASVMAAAAIRISSQLSNIEKAQIVNAILLGLILWRVW